MIAAVPASLVNNGEYIIVDTINQLQNKSNYSAEYITALLNSRLISWYAYRFIFGRAIRTMQFDNPVSSRILMPQLDIKSPKKRATHERITESVREIIKTKASPQLSRSAHDKELHRKKLLILDDRINSIVYSLFGLTKNEIGVVEGEVQ